MPQIPYTPYPTGEAAATPTSYGRLPGVGGVMPDAFGAPQARAMEKLGSAVQNAGDRAFKEATDWQNMWNDAEKNDLYNKAETKLGLLEEDFYSKSGKDAVNAREDYLAKINQLRQDTLGEASNPAVRRSLDSVLTRRAGLAIVSGARHAGVEARKYVSNEGQATVNNAINSADGQSEEQFKFGLSVANTAIDDVIRNAGLPPDSAQAKEMRDKATGAAWTNWLTSRAKIDPVGTLNSLTKYQSEIPASVFTSVQSKVLQQVHAAGGQAIANSVMTPNLENPNFGKASSDMGTRNNNFTNITASAWAMGLPGVIGKEGRFVRFATPEMGLRAADVNLQNYANKGLNTVAKIITRWSPPNENDTEALIDAQAKRLGVDPHQELPMNDPAFRAKFITGMIQQETGKTPFTADQVKSALIGSPRKDDNRSLGELQDQARAMALKEMPREKYGAESDAHVEQAVQAVTAAYARTNRVQRDEDTNNLYTVRSAIFTPDDAKVPKNLNELLANPETKKAYDDLVQSRPEMVKKINDALVAANKRDANELTDERKTKYETLRGIMVTNPSQFMKEDLLNDDLTKIDRNFLQRKQDQMKKIAEGPTGTTKIMHEMANLGVFTALGVPAWDKKGAFQKDEVKKFAGQLDIEIERFQKNKGAEPTDEDIRNMAKNLLRVTTPKTIPIFGRETRNFEEVPPPDEEKKIMETMRANGIQPLPDKVNAAWRAIREARAAAAKEASK